MIPCNCTTRCCRCACSPGAPLDTSCITIQAQEVRLGDYLDTRECGRKGFIARVFGTGRSTSGRTILDVEAERAQHFSPTTKVKVWRDSRAAEPRPIDLRTDRPVQNLTHAMTLGRAGLNNIFKIGSLWEVGPFVEGVNPKVVRVISKNEQGAAHTSGVNYSHAPEDAAALGKAAWFIQTETIYTPHGATDRDSTGQSPIVLCELTPRMAAVAGVACCDCATYVPPSSCRVLSCNAGVIQSMRADADSLRDTITDQSRQIRDLERKLASAQLRANMAERKVARVERAISG